MIVLLVSADIATRIVVNNWLMLFVVCGIAGLLAIVIICWVGLAQAQRRQLLAPVVGFRQLLVRL